jgi:MFS family permease
MERQSQHGPQQKAADGKEAKGYQTGGWKAHWIVIVTSVLMVIAAMDTHVMRVILQPMKVELGLTDAEAGSAITVLTLSVALFAYPISYLVDRWSRKKMMALMAIGWSVSTLTTGLARNYAGVLFSRLFVGAGEAAHGTGGVAMITAAYPQAKRSRMLGVFLAAAPIGIALGYVVGGALSVAYGWRAPFFIFAPLGIAFGVAALFLHDYKTVKQGKGHPNSGFFKSIRYLLKVKTLPWFYMGHGLENLVVMAGAWMPALMMRQAGIKEDVASYILGASVVFAVIGSLVGGRVGDALAKKNRRSRLILPTILALTWSLLQIAAILLLMSAPQGSGIFTTGFIGFALLGAIATFGFYMAGPTLTAANQEVVTADKKATTQGFSTLVHYIVGAWAPLIIGGISDAIGGRALGLAVGIIVLSTAGILAACCFYMSSRYFVKDSQKITDAVIEG